MQAFFSTDGSYGLQFLVVFAVILPLTIGGYLLYRRLSGRGMSPTAGPNGRGRQPRLGIVDIYELDRQRQLILLRRDNVEHLLLVGGPNDVVIERHIQRGAGARYAAENARDPDLAAGDPALDPPRAERFLDSPAPPAFAMPEVVPSGVPGAEPPHPERTPPLDPGLFEPEVVTPGPARARPASPVSRLIRRTPPPLGGTPPEGAPTTPIPAAPAPAVPPAPEPVPETPPVIAGRGHRPVDPAVLSDMARQLQVALKRPSSAVTPPPGGAEVPPLPPAPDLRPDPLAAAMAAVQAEPPPPAPAKPAAPAPAPAPPAAAKPAPAQAETSAAPAPKPIEAKPAPEPKPEAATKPAPAPAPVPPPPPAKPAPAKPAEAAPQAAPEPKPAPQPSPPKPEAPKPVSAAPAAETTAQNPFSVEEIEAEFARLLGRPLDNKG